MQLKTILFLAACLFISRSNGAEENDHGDTPSSISTTGVTNCVGSESSVLAIVNATNGYTLETVVINCLAFADNSSTISFGVVSHTSRDGSMPARSTVQCVNDYLVVGKSSRPFTDNITSCHECMDEENIDSCNGDSDCAERCSYCYGPSQAECLVCDTARYNGECTDNCPTGYFPNPELGNECQCPGNYGGSECRVCQLTKMDCIGSYNDNIYFDETNCMCTSCPSGFYYQLADSHATVPSTVIGAPLGEECESHEERKRAEVGHDEGETSLLTGEVFMCVETCEEDGFLASASNENICYACNKKYCLECDRTGKQCEECRNGTLLNEMEHECKGFFEEICERALELIHEVEEEEEGLKEYQQHLKIALPIVCVFVAFVFIGLAVFAHFRYPHVGHQKRHRKPNKATEMRKKTEFDKVLRPQSTVIFR